MNMMNIILLAAGENKNDLGSQVLKQLFPNIPMLIAHLISSLFLLLILWKWVYKPFRNLLHNRHLAIKSKLDDAADKQALANKDWSLATKLLNNAKNEAEIIIKDAHLKAHEIHREIIEKTRNEISILNNEAKHDIIRERKVAKQKIQDEIKEIALELASKIMAKEIDSKKHQQLIDNFIEQLAEKNKERKYDR